MAKPSEIIESAAFAIAGGWIQGENARDMYGEEVGPRELEACKFCMLGALEAAANTPWDGNDLLRARLYVKRVTGGNIPSFNDSNHATVGKVVEKLLDAAEHARGNNE